MRSRRPSPEHTEAVARRLAELSAQLSAAREPAGAEVVDLISQAPVDHAVGDAWWSDHTRVAMRPPLTVVPPVADGPDEPPAPPVPSVGPPVVPGPSLPVPGRHAARRPLDWAPALVPESLRGTVRLGSAQLTAVAVLVAVGLALTCWWVVRGDPETPVPVALEQQSSTGPGAPVDPRALEAPVVPDTPVVPADPSGGAAAPASVVVDVAGKVRRPGIVVLDTGARVVDALEAAGGARPGVDLTPLNLARPLVDGEQVVVGVSGGAAAPGVAPPAAGAPGSPAPTTLVDLNLADQALLETLPQVGPVTAAAIIAWRAEHGGFTSVTELLEVDGIGDATLAQLTPYVTV